MEIFIVALVALLASGLTLFSGFGLGTLLMPVVALFFPIEIAIAVTAIVHLANNIFKVVLLGKHADRQVLLKFGSTALVAAFIGAWVLGWLSDTGSNLNFNILGIVFQTSLLQVVVGSLILIFVLLEFSKQFARASLDKKYLPLGGLISGFFGGLSGHQGAFRSLFLIKVGLTKEQFVATGVMVAVLVDVARLIVYGNDLDFQVIDWDLVVAASLSAFVGAYFGKRLLQKVTIQAVHLMVSVLLILVALALILGLI